MITAPASDEGANPSPYDVAWTETALHHIHAVVRSVIAVSVGYGLLARHPGALPFAALVLGFVAYALILQWLAIRESPIPDAMWVHWLDAAWYLTLVAVGDGVAAVFPAVLFFPVLFASLQCGFPCGFAVACASALVMLLLGGAAAGLTSLQVWMAPLALVVLGYLIAGWSSSVIEMRRYIALVRELAELSNPRMGFAPLVRETMTRLCAHFQAESGVLVSAECGEPRVFRCAPDQARGTWLPPESAQALAAQLLALPAGAAVAYGTRPWHDELRCHAAGAAGERCDQAARAACMSIANLLECRAFVSAPLYHRGQPSGRLLLASRRRAFQRRDIGLLRRMAETISVLLENVALVERLVGEAAEYERKRLSRDLHDSAIQPFIGIKFGLEALRRKLAPGAALADDVERLVRMASAELAGLRNVVGGLREPGAAHGGALLATVRRQAQRFSELFGIHVDVSAEGEMPGDKELEGEIFHMVGEGLSNIWRHTQGRRARLRLRREGEWLTLQILNERGRDAEAPRFMPASIAARAASLGGSVRVESTDRGETAVTVRIPLASACTTLSACGERAA